MKKIMVGMAVALLALTGCTTGGGGTDGSGRAIAPTCHGDQWAVGDSITNERSLDIAGWPNQGPAYGQWTNFGDPGATAAWLSSWTISELSMCSGAKPSLVALAAGLND